MKHSEKKQEPSLTKNFIVYFVRTVVSVLVPIITFPYASRILGPSGIGRVQYAQTWVTYFQLFACLGINSYAIREGTRCRDDKEKLGKLCTEIFRINCMTTVLAYAAFFIFWHSFGPIKDYKGLLLLFSLSIAANALSIEWVYSIFEDYTYISIRSVLFQILSLLALFLLVNDQQDYYMYAIVLMLPAIGTAMTNIVHARKLISWGGKREYHYLYHLKPIILIFGITIASNLYNSLDTTMLGLQMGDTAVGYYTSAVKLARNVLVIVTSMCTVLSPRAFYYAGLDDKSKFLELTKKATNVILGFAIPCGIGLIVLAPQLISLFSGPEFGAAVQPMRVLSINLIFSAVNGLLGWQVLVTLNKEKWTFAAMIVGCVIDFVLNSLFIPLYGVTGAAAATLLTEMSVFVAYMLLAKRLMAIGQCFVEVWQYLVGVVAFFPIAFYVNCVVGKNEVVTVAVTVVLCAAEYAIVLITLHNPLGERVKEKVAGIVSHRGG